MSARNETPGGEAPRACDKLFIDAKLAELALPDLSEEQLQRAAELAGVKDRAGLMVCPGAAVVMKKAARRRPVGCLRRDYAPAGGYVSGNPVGGRAAWVMACRACERWWALPSIVAR